MITDDRLDRWETVLDEILRTVVRIEKNHGAKLDALIKLCEVSKCIDRNDTNVTMRSKASCRAT